MGRRKLRLDRFEIDKFNLGYFPNQDLEDVPKGGSRDLDHVIYYHSALRKFPGMDRINSSAAATLRGNGLFYLDVSGTTKRTAVFGNGFYEDVSGTWTARTGAITITDGANNLVQSINHQQGANKYAIYCNNVDAPWKWTGSGNAAVLGGSPPIFGSIAKYHDTIFGSVNELVYFSDTGDPETWDTAKWVIPFEKDVKCLIDNGQKLAVLKEYNIGSVSGFDYLDFSAEESEISNVGCVGRLAACKALFGEKKSPVIATVSRDGVYLIDQAFGSTKLFGDFFFSRFNQSELHKAVVSYSALENLLYVALPDGSSTENDYLIIVDMVTGAFWPATSIHSSKLRVLALMRDDTTINEWMYFIDTAGYAFKFNFSTLNYHTGTATQAIPARWKSNKHDLKDVYQVRWPMLLAEASGDWNLTMSIGFGISNQDTGSGGSINLLSEGDLLGSSFVLGASTLGGSDYVFNTLEGYSPFGRWITVLFTNSGLSESFNVKKVEIQMKRRRMGSNDK
jgi:hypothetical protein